MTYIGRKFSPQQLAKVPCTVAIRTARALVEEVPQVATSSVGQLAKFREDHSERDVQKLSKKMRLTLPIPLSDVQVGSEMVPMLRMSDWSKFIFQHNLWHRLCGLDEPDMERCCAIWKQFWGRYEQINPGHEIFQRSGHDLSRTCAVMLHGDEGRSRRKSPVMVVSTHSVLGFGLSTSKRKQKTKYLAQKLNYEQPTWTTRFLLSVLPKQYYNEENETAGDSDPIPGSDARSLSRPQSAV